MCPISRAQDDIWLKAAIPMRAADEPYLLFYFPFDEAGMETGPEIEYSSSAHGSLMDRSGSLMDCSGSPMDCSGSLMDPLFFHALLLCMHYRTLARDRVRTRTELWI